MESVENCPTPIILEDDEGIDEESEDATVENHVDIQYSELPTRLQIDFTFGISNTFSLWIRRYRGRTHVSMEECLKHYLNISLPMFQQSNIILVISHMYFRRKSFNLLI